MSLNLLLTPNNLGPFYMNILNVGQLYNAQALTFVIPFTMTGAYIGGAGNIRVSKNNDWISLSITQPTMDTVTSAGQPLDLTGTLPALYRPNIGNCIFPAIVTSSNLPVGGWVEISTAGVIQVTTTGGFPAGIAGITSFSCQYVQI